MNQDQANGMWEQIQRRFGESKEAIQKKLNDMKLP